MYKRQTFDYWRYKNIFLTLTLIDIVVCCRKPAPFEALEVDQYVWGIVQHLTANPHAVEVSIDHTASWRPIDHGQSSSHSDNGCLLSLFYTLMHDRDQKN